MEAEKNVHMRTCMNNFWNFPWKRHLTDFIHPHLTVVKYLIIIFCHLSEVTIFLLVFVKKNRVMLMIYVKY